MVTIPMSTSVRPALEREVYTVSRLNQSVRYLLEDTFPLLWIEGEISNLSRPVSGHLYFSLKDANAQVRCALFRHRNAQLRGELANGQQVLVQARLSLYEPRGDYQLIVEHLEEAGGGALRRAYEELRLRLDREGLFAVEHKRPIPRFPRRIGVITSPSGAAIRDVLSVLQRRFPALPVLLYPVAVQGEGAGAQIARAIALAAQRRECEVLLLVRGGGSLEDLQAFNEEAVARAIHACAIPLVCGVGHEIDVTIADFAADVRAPTPSAAAELVSPDRMEWLHRFSRLEERLAITMRRQLNEFQQKLLWLEQGLARQHPGRRLQPQLQRLDDIEQRLQRALATKLEHLQTRVKGLATQLRLAAPGPRIARLQERQQALSQRLEAALRHRLERDAQRLMVAGHALHTVSPLSTLGRGYAIIRHPSGEVIRRAEQVQRGNRVEALLGEGRLICRIEAAE